MLFYILSNIVACIYHILSLYSYIAFYSNRISKKRYAILCLIANPISILSSILTCAWGNLSGQLIWLLIHIDIVFYSHKFCNKIIKLCKKSEK